MKKNILNKFINEKNNNNTFIVTKMTEKRVKKFETKGKYIEFKFVDTPVGENPIKWLEKGVRDVLKFAMKDLDPHDQVGLTFCSQDFKEKGPGWVAFKEASSYKFEDVWAVIYSVFQSNANSYNTDTFCLGITSVRMPRGEGRRRKYNSFEEFRTKCGGIIKINNDDNLCLPRALVTAIAQKSTDKDERAKMRKNYKGIQTTETLKLIQNAGVTIPANGCGVPEIFLFQTYLTEFNITVYNFGCKNNEKGRDIIFDGRILNGKEFDKNSNINLLYHNNHFDVISSVTAAFCCSYYCEKCHIAYNTKNIHQCDRDIENKDVPNQYKEHIDVNEHKFCTICKTFKNIDHLCYIQPNNGVPPSKKQLFIFFDFETRQEKIYNILENKLHEVNLCVFNQRCIYCVNIVNLAICDSCGVRQQILEHDCVKNFIEYVLNVRLNFDVFCIAHNGQSFDHQFILNYMLTETLFTPYIIQRGTKILLLSIENVKFIDSLNYFPMKLSSLPAAFDLPSDFKKGYFPHLFNKIVNKDYIGTLPAIEYYSPDSMHVDERQKLLEWYDYHKNDNFIMKKELIEYCTSDVNILTLACLKFRQNFLSECNVCPFTEAITIASACNLVYRRNFLEPNKISIIPKWGYRFKDNQSKIAIHWLLWLESQRKIKIKHAGVGREVKILGQKVDGYCEETNQIFEFHGCYYHGHTECFIHNRDKPINKNSTDTLNSRLAATRNKTERLRKANYEVIEEWECHFKEQLKTDHEMNSFENHPVLTVSPLEPRDAFYGGRTGNTRLYYKVKNDEKIKYTDVCSLYPWVCKYGKFPVGHPKLYVGNTECRKINLSKINGLIKCKILPPQNLFHPVLPQKQNGKLMFSLCSRCSEIQNVGNCSHSDEQRAISGTWVIDEVLKALEKGYIICNIYEIYEYEVEQYDPITKSGGLFSQMMDKFLGMKQAASGFPPGCSTIDEKEAYIKQFFNTEGIKLEFSSILKNSGLRSLAKLMLNSFWGKFGQRENLPKTTIINKPNELYEMLSDPSKIVNNLLIINENTLVLNWEYREEDSEILSTGNVCIAAYTTTQARLKLYEYLEKLEERVLYYDTDSIIFISNDGQYEPPIGNCIGDMTNELEQYGKESYINEFVSGGPKNYGYKVWSTKEQAELVVCKVKGIQLNYNTSKILNFFTMKDLILESSDCECDKEIYIISDNIGRTSEHEVITRKEKKTYRINALKRKFYNTLDSVPYGFKKKKSVK